MSKVRVFPSSSAYAPVPATKEFGGKQVKFGRHSKAISSGEL